MILIKIIYFTQLQVLKKKTMTAEGTFTERSIVGMLPLACNWWKNGRRHWGATSGKRGPTIREIVPFGLKLESRTPLKRWRGFRHSHPYVQKHPHSQHPGKKPITQPTSQRPYRNCNAGQVKEDSHHRSAATTWMSGVAEYKKAKQRLFDQIPKSQYQMHFSIYIYIFYRHIKKTFTHTHTKTKILQYKVI